MSGFSADWLSLRENADRRARALPILAAVRNWAEQVHIGAATPFEIVDLGAGTGSTLRVLAPYLPTPQVWTLLDRDPTLLAAALAGAEGGLCATMLQQGTIAVRTRTADLAAGDALTAALAGTVAGDTRLITASALLDLVSEDWCRRLIAVAARPGVAVYAALTYDGRMTLSPPHLLDARIVALFNRHQQRDKGFGAALGPDATLAIERIAAASGARVRSAASDWRLGPGQPALLGALLDGWAEAARQTSQAWKCEPDSLASIDAWATLRRRQAEAGELRVVVGHRDLFAVW